MVMILHAGGGGLCGHPVVVDVWLSLVALSVAGSLVGGASQCSRCVSCGYQPSQSPEGRRTQNRQASEEHHGIHNRPGLRH